MTDAKTEPKATHPVVVIAGGGIAGLYAAYLLGKRGYPVTVLEQGDRWGGRIETIRMPRATGEFIAEYGPMRFEPDLQQLLDKLVTHLGLHFAPFSPTTAPISPTQYELEDAEKFENTADLLKWAVLKMFYESDLDPTVFDAPPQSQLAALKGIIDSHINGHSYEEVQAYLDELRTTARLRGKADGPLLRDMGLWNALAETISPGALSRIRESGTFYHFLQHNPSAVEWGIFWLRQASTLGEVLETIPHGVSTLVDKLLERIEAECGDKVTLVLNARVRAVENGKLPGEIEMTVQQTNDGVTYRRRADHVILAVPQAALAEIAGAFQPQIRSDIDGIMPLPLLKTFLLTRKPWWKPHTSAQSHAWLAPTRELHYFTYPEDPSCPRHADARAECICKHELGMVMLYTDVPSIEFWKGLVPSGEQFSAVVFDEEHPEPGERLKRALVRHLLVEANANVLAQIDLQRSVVIKAIEERNPALSGFVKAREGQRLTTILYEYVKSPARTDAECDELQTILQHCFDTDEDCVALLNGEPPLSDDDLVKLEMGNVVSYGIHDWSRMPFAAAAHVWRPGYDSVEISKRLRAFPLNGSTTNNVHVCGEAYSDFQGFIEGSLRSALQVLTTIDANEDWSL